MKTVLRWVQADPIGFASASGGHLVAGWIASFTAESAVSPFAQGLFVAVGVLAVAGSVRRAWSNHLDGWYALASLALLFLWVFREDAMRRLLYPVVPLLLLHAVLLVRPVVAKLGAHRLGRWAWPAIVALPLAFTLPALLLVAEKAAYREPLMPGFAGSMAGMKDFYTTIRVHEAKANAARGIAMLAGLEALRSATPPDARIMWMRPDYVAVLGGRRGVAWFYHGGLDRLMRDALHSRADYIIAGNTYKSDMLGEQDDRFESVEVLAGFARPVLAIPNAVLGVDEFVLMKIDAQALEARVRERAASRGR
jgi:hypothetical protein